LPTTRTLVLTFLLAPALAAQHEEIIDTFVDGSVRARYTIDAGGRRTGAYIRYHRNGKARIRATYSRGKLSGLYQEYYRSGDRKKRSNYKAGARHGEHREFSKDGKRTLTAHYQKGVKHGEFRVVQDGKTLTKQDWSQGDLATLNGIAPFPRRLQTIRDDLARILKAPDEVPGADQDPLLPKRLTALRRLQAYRYLCRLRYADMALNPAWNELCDFGARLCKAIGRLDHTPKKPAGMDDESYRKGYRGTSHSNLSQGSGMVRSVDAYMFDSDQKNIQGIGHRRWCLNPTMKLTGFGEAGRFSAMWSFDGSGTGAKDIEAVFYPPQGFVPIAYFGAGHAWSIQILRGSRAKKADARIRIIELDALYLPKGPALELNHLGTVSNCLVFRPSGLHVQKGRRYWCEVSLDGGKTVRYRYLVEFV
jgi:hypothetical protein